VPGFYAHVVPMESDKSAIPPELQPADPDNAPAEDSLHCRKTIFMTAL
jgi:hypothetical protein